MEIINALECTTKEQFYAWLQEHHATEKECWVNVKRSNKPLDNSVLWYFDAVEMALCFGWIDSTAKSIDGCSWQRFTPRQKARGGRN